AKVLKAYKLRLTVIPLLLFLVTWSSYPLYVVLLVVVVFWDIYHTSMQNFGLCRIYDAKKGNDPHMGRRLDLWLNHLIYIGPIFFGLSYSTLTDSFLQLGNIGWKWPVTFVATLDEVQSAFSLIVLLAGVLFIPLYILGYWKLMKHGYIVSSSKVFLLISTAITTFCAWTLMPPMQAHFVVNFFHGLQYFALVWWIDRKSFSRFVGGNTGLTLALYVVPLIVLGCAYRFARVLPSDYQVIYAFFICVSLVHFWFDGFIWSVRKRAV
ncbi:MAG: hypothetical protein QGI45_05895, partial [Myxococcota bacterium]|nr:hypothetical protein [Myxococcota bacterium]